MEQQIPRTMLDKIFSPSHSVDELDIAYGIIGTPSNPTWITKHKDNIELHKDENKALQHYQTIIRKIIKDMRIEEQVKEQQDLDTPW